MAKRPTKPAEQEQQMKQHVNAPQDDILDRLIRSLFDLRFRSLSPPSLLRPQYGKTYPHNYPLRVIIEADDLMQQFSVNMLYVVYQFGTYIVQANGHWPNNNDTAATYPLNNADFDAQDLVYDRKLNPNMVMGRMYLFQVFKGGQFVTSTTFTAS